MTSPVALEPLAEHHRIGDFFCGEPSLDEWLKRRALANQVGDASRTYVLCMDGAVIGYHAIASGSIALVDASGRLRRNMPDPIPMAILARLAVDQAHQGRGLGRALFKDAATRVVRAADILGIRGLLVHALNQDAKDFYLALGLSPSPREAMMLMATLTNLRAWLG